MKDHINKSKHQGLARSLPLPLDPQFEIHVQWMLTEISFDLYLEMILVSNPGHSKINYCLHRVAQYIANKNAVMIWVGS